MSKGGGRELKRAKAPGVLDAMELAVGLGQHVDGRHVLGEDRRLGGIQADDLEAMTIGELAGDGPEHAALRRSYDHGRLHLDYPTGKRKA